MDWEHFRFIDLFAGIGGIRLGFEAVGGHCVFLPNMMRMHVKPMKPILASIRCTSRSRSQKFYIEIVSFWISTFCEWSSIGYRARSGEMTYVENLLDVYQSVVRSIKITFSVMMPCHRCCWMRLEKITGAQRERWKPIYIDNLRKSIVNWQMRCNIV